MAFFVLIWYTRLIFSRDGGSSLSGNGSKDRRWFEQNRRRVPGSPPAPVFAVVWSVLYALIGVAGFLYWRNVPFATAEYDAGLVLYFVNYLLNKLWTPLFFGARMVKLAALDLVLMLGTGAAFLGMCGTEGQWVAFTLYAFSVAWMIYALYLNVYQAFCLPNCK